MKSQLIEYAERQGFALAHISPPARFERWSENVASRTDLSLSRLADDPRALMPECRSVALLIYPYQPYELEPDDTAPSAYYVASNAARQAADRVAEFLVSHGHAALASPRIPLKPLAERTGLGRYGRNGVIAVGEFGSRVALQCVLTDAELEYDPVVENPGLSNPCEHCHACVKACPVGALRGDALVDGTCLRNQSYDSLLPEQRRAFIGGSLIGCDICQDCCPRNFRVEPVEIPEAVARGMELSRLLSGDLSAAAELVGANYARRSRMLPNACFAAANTGRKELLPLLETLADDEIDTIRDAAAWAAARLSG